MSACANPARGSSEHGLRHSVKARMRIKFLMPMLFAVACLLGSIAPALAGFPEADVSRKLSVAAAKGELTNQQVLVFKEQISNALKGHDRSLQDQRLGAISYQIDRARKSRSIASRGIFRWF
jgi:hypothetical protein